MKPQTLILESDFKTLQPEPNTLNLEY